MLCSINRQDRAELWQLITYMFWTQSVIQQHCFSGALGETKEPAHGVERPPVSQKLMPGCVATNTA